MNSYVFVLRLYSQSSNSQSFHNSVQKYVRIDLQLVCSKKNLKMLNKKKKKKIVQQSDTSGMPFFFVFSSNFIDFSL